MPALSRNLTDADLRKIQQVFKWLVYTLLLANFGFYIYEDWNRAIHTLTAGASASDWAAGFATSIDEAGWFILLFMFELETYVLDDEDWKGWIANTVQGVRLLCFAMLAHTVYAFGVTVVDYSATVPVEDAAGLCDLAERDVSFVYNLEYRKVDAENCSGLPDAGTYYWLGNDPVVTSKAGLALERQLAWADLVEAIAWLVIVLAIEAVVRLQGRGVTEGPVIRAASAIKAGLYVLLATIAAWWAWLSHWLYTWDEFLWIAGFAAIEMNVSEWRKELLPRDSESLA